MTATSKAESERAIERTAAPSSSRASRWVFPVALSAVVLAGLGHLAYHASYTLDDAYISYRYSRNCARGLGLVYNPGEYVKGYSNTLYTLLMVLPALLGKDPNPFSKLLSAAAFVGMLCVFVHEYAEIPRPARDRSLWVIALCALSSAVAVHFMSGLETGLYCALIVAAVTRRLDEQARAGKPWSALLLSGVVLSRPEGILIVAALFVHDAIWRTTARRWQRQDAWFYLLPLAVYFGELAWSLHYYGDALPQTFRAKTHQTHSSSEAALNLWHGVEHQFTAHSYLAKGLASTGFGWVALLALPLSLAARGRARRNAAFALVVLALVGFISEAGDDWAPAFRFGMPMLPPLFLLIAEALGVVAALFRRHQRLAGWALALGALAISLPLQRRQSAAIQATRYVNAENKLVQGAFFATLAEPGSTLSSFDIGGQGYGAGGFDVLDTGGLVSRETVGCPSRAPLACSEYARSVLPTLIRVHGNRRHDEYVVKASRKELPYLALDHAKYWLQRSQVFAAAAPMASTRIDLPVGEDASLIAHDASPVLSVKQPSAVSLYWQRGAAFPEAAIDRRVEWSRSSPSGRFDARASLSIWKQLDDRNAWTSSELFIDRVSLEAPGEPGRYQLELVVADTRIVIASVDVVRDALAAQRAQALSARAQQLMAAGASEPAIELFERAVQLSTTVRAEYQRQLAGYAERGRSEAQTLAGRDPIAALRLGQRLAAALHRAAWSSGSAGSALRVEIDANAAFCRGIIARRLSGLPGVLPL